MIAAFIRADAESAVSEAGDRRPSEVARALGADVRFLDLGSFKGLYMLVEGNGHIIVNSRLPEREREMVIAHELGHHRLHKDAAVDASFMDSMLFDSKGRAEFEANIFAAELMIDDSSVLESDLDCYSLAGALGVHPQLLLFKLYSMNCSGYDIPLPEECRAGFLKS